MKDYLNSFPIQMSKKSNQKYSPRTIGAESSRMNSSLAAVHPGTFRIITAGFISTFDWAHFPHVFIFVIFADLPTNILPLN